MNAALLSSKRMDWNTPKNVLEKIRAFAPIGFDPCSNATSKVGAAASFTSGGLEVSWADYGLVFVNPPYSRALKEWAVKIVNERQKPSTEIIALVPSRTDTKWFHYLFENRSYVCFWKGRITFEGAPAPAPFPSALFYFGWRWERFSEVFKDCGLVV